MDVVLCVDRLPPNDLNTKQQFMKSWMANPTPRTTWELGGGTNFLLAASRLGMRAASAGHVGQDVFGRFLVEELEKEGVMVHSMGKKGASSESHSLLDSTLICFVQVDPDHKHSFCSQYDFEKKVLFGDDADVSDDTQKLLTSAKGVFVNGYIFDECSPGYVLKLCNTVKNGGGVLMFDPGPRSFPIMEERRPGREAMREMVSMADVMLMTKDEAGVVMGTKSTNDCASRIVEARGSETQWCVIKDGPRGSYLRARGACEPMSERGYSVKVVDTVGCGDSFAAAIALGYLRGCDPSAVLALANAVGAGTAMNKGAGRNVASMDRVLKILESRSDRGEVQSAMEMIGLAPLRQ